MDSSGTLQNSVSNKVNEWLDDELQEWTSVEISHTLALKYQTHKENFYVWLDAPIGYMASFKNFCDKTDYCFDDYWNANLQTKCIISLVRIL